MSEDIIDYGQSRTIGAVFVAVLISMIVYGLYLMIAGPGNPSTIFDVYARNSFILAILSLVFGVGAKRSIDYIKGKWEEEKRWVEFDEYERVCFLCPT